MQRYNLFQSAHHTLQDVLFNGAISLQKEEAPSFQKVEDAIMVARLQARAKEDCIFPAIDAFEPSVVDAVKQQHAAAFQLSYQLEGFLKEEKQLSYLRQAYNQLLVTQLKCMQKGEEVLLPVLWHYYSDTELKKLEERLQKVMQRQMEQATAIAAM
jgi:hypothetical protein